MTRRLATTPRKYLQILAAILISALWFAGAWRIAYVNCLKVSHIERLQTLVLPPGIAVPMLNGFFGLLGVGLALQTVPLLLLWRASPAFAKTLFACLCLTECAFALLLCLANYLSTLS